MVVILKKGIVLFNLLNVAYIMYISIMHLFGRDCDTIQYGTHSFLFFFLRNLKFFSKREFCSIMVEEGFLTLKLKFF